MQITNEGTKLTLRWKTGTLCIMMTKLCSTSYYLVLHLAILFIVFSVGLPIVVASCPMVQNSQRPTCSQCLPDDGGGASSFTKYADRSCCATVFAAGRNTTEYMRSGSDQVRALSAVVLPLPAVFSIADQAPAQQSIIDHYPVVPLREDIPLFISSLLI